MGAPHYTPAHHFEGGKGDPEFRTKPQIALEVVERATKMKPPFRAVVADILYGEHRGFRYGLWQRGIPYVLVLKPTRLVAPDRGARLRRGGGPGCSLERRG